MALCGSDEMNESSVALMYSITIVAVWDSSSKNAP